INIKKENLCFEISERHEFSGDNNLEQLLQHYDKENYNIAIDDFGVGYSGYKLLYDSTPDFIKIDRFFLQAIEKNLKKKILVRNITHLAVQLGIKVIAEGVETKAELLACKEIGCHLVQGYLVQHPTRNSTEILQHYPHIQEIIANDKRTNTQNSKIDVHIDKINPIRIQNDMSFVVEYFKNNKETTIVPIINESNEPLGIICEAQIKDFLYSPFGISLLLNDESKSKIKNLLRICGNTDINSNISTIIELFSNNPDSLGIIITKNSKYYGFLSARSIISIMNEENIISARDQNPLTKLPGNVVIEKYISELAIIERSYLLCYFDLDNFKAFNDVYGFRNGDRVIQLFADILRKELSSDIFKAHIGGDDFFVAFETEQELEMDKCIPQIVKILDNFSNSAKEFYSQEDKQRAYIVSKDRHNNIKRFPLLSASASLLKISTKSKNKHSECINNVLSVQKKVAKNATNHLALSCLL
ncbi:MAG TPA: GGDEF domain-containing protein, partial [Saprospiraceae bacterium]|nr:GGDEF domain-containing protein [Saprospiraceae bacterium]